MNIDLKKSLFVSLTALGFLAAGAIGSNPAFAKNRVRVTSNAALKTAGSSRNVTFTGKNALYNKAATLKGARKVASTSTLRSIANSGRSSQNVRHTGLQRQIAGWFTTRSSHLTASIAAGFMAAAARPVFAAA